MSVMGFQKKLDGGGVCSIQVYFGFWNFVNIAKPLSSSSLPSSLLGLMAAEIKC